MEVWGGTLENLGVKTDFWQGKKVVLTGHTGFKGSWLAIWLKSMGANVIGISLDPPTSPSLYEKANVADGMISLRQDIRDADAIKDLFIQHQPEIVFHLAAQPLVRYSYDHPVETYATNVMGTLHVLEGIRHIDSVKSAIMVTTDKCYENKEWCWGYRENEPMGGYDPYSSSKGATELLIASYRNSYFADQRTTTGIASVRAGNVIGGGDWAKDRLIPDIVRAFLQHEPVHIRNPHAIRPWQHVLEPLAGYLMLAEKLFVDHQYAQAWNFGPYDNDARSVEWIVKKIADKWEDADWVIDQGDHPHEAHYLKLDCSKAHTELGWKPAWDLETALTKIIDWYKSEQTAGVEALCLQQIAAYTNDMMA